MNSSDERLESWKKIAAYLRRDVRTVQRWEQTNGLPIHRLNRAQRAVPYAYKKELDSWWASQSNLPTETAILAPLSAARRRLVISAVSLIGALVVVLGLFLRTGDAPARSVAVLPFVDLSEGMPNEEFADGISEELIDRLNRIPGFKVPAPTSTFFYKNKQVPVPEVARALGVAYVLDGSVRRSGDQLRVAARLIRATDSAVVWSESYDRPWSEILAMQDDIAKRTVAALERALAGS
jgi:TolB-like protein